MTNYRPGDHVHVAGFGKGIVREVRNGGRYLVAIKGRAMESRAAQLTPIAARSPRGGAPDVAAEPEAVADSGRIVTLDLHGHTVEGALQALETTLDEALRQDASALHVIHGRSGGRIKAAVHRRLGEWPSVRTYRVDPRNPGVTIVVL